MTETMITDADAWLLDYLEHLAALVVQIDASRGARYSSIHEYVLRNGRLAESGPLTDEELRVVRRALGRGAYPIGECWWNARRLARRSFGALVYVEGFAIPVGVPIPVGHAWCEIDGRVVDPTWSPRVLGDIPTGSAYFGVPFPNIETLIRDERQGPVIDDWAARWPLLQEG